MSKNIRKLSISDFIRKRGRLLDLMPFYLTFRDHVIAEVTKPGAKWYTCENCGDNTQQVLKFKYNKGNWGRLILCEECQDKML